MLFYTLSKVSLKCLRSNESLTFSSILCWIYILKSSTYAFNATWAHSRYIIFTNVVWVFEISEYLISVSSPITRNLTRIRSNQWNWVGPETRCKGGQGTWIETTPPPLVFFWDLKRNQNQVWFFNGSKNQNQNFFFGKTRFQFQF
jgi:hypothetical protein